MPQGIPPHFSILRAIKNWMMGRPGNEKIITTSNPVMYQCLSNLHLTMPHVSTVSVTVVDSRHDIMLPCLHLLAVLSSQVPMPTSMTFT